MGSGATSYSPFFKKKEKKRWGHHPAAYSPWGGPAKSLLFEVLKRATAGQEGWPKIQRILEMRQGLSISLEREVAKQLSLRCRVHDSLDPTT